MTQALYCPRHPGTETGLSCTRCEDLICPRCMVHSSVGARCPDCAKVVPLPIYEVPRRYLVMGICGALLSGTIGGTLFVLVAPALLTILYLPYVLIVGVGYLIGVVVSRCVRQRKGRRLKIIVSGGMIVACLITVLLPSYIGLPNVTTGLAPILLMLSWALSFFVALIKF